MPVRRPLAESTMPALPAAAAVVAALWVLEASRAAAAIWIQVEPGGSMVGWVGVPGEPRPKWAVPAGEKVAREVMWPGAEATVAVPAGLPVPQVEPAALPDRGVAAREERRRILAPSAVEAVGVVDPVARVAAAERKRLVANLVQAACPRLEAWVPVGSRVAAGRRKRLVADLAWAACPRPEA